MNQARPTLTYETTVPAVSMTRMKPYVGGRLWQSVSDPESKWEDPDLGKLAA
jgi:hypothetical protein